MGDRSLVAALAGTLFLASCGRPDASGIYLYKADRQTALIQLVQNKDGAVTGRLEAITIADGGGVNDQSVNLDGAVSNHDLILKPTSAWFGGLSASGTFTHDVLTLSHQGQELKARRSSIGAYEKAVTQLQAKAAAERRQVAEAKARIAERQAQEATIKDAADRDAKLDAVATELRTDADRLDNGVASAPDFGQRAVQNTARIVQMGRLAPTLSASDRGRLIVSANQIVVGTNQIEIARTQYALSLNTIVQRSAPLATEVQRFCDSPEGAAFASRCLTAKAAASNFQSSLVHGSTVFKGYKQTVQTELNAQNQIVQRLGG